MSSYPESLVYFRRSAIDPGTPDGYKAENQRHFYSHFVIEYVWNREADHGEKNAKAAQRAGHPRSGYGIYKGSNWGTNYGNWHQLPISYGQPGKGFNPNYIAERRQHNLCSSGNRFKNREKGDAYEAWWMTIPMPTREQRYVWIDMLTPIRAIYVPVSYSASEDYPDIGVWAMVSFIQGGSLSIWDQRYQSQYTSRSSDRTLGLGVNRELTLGLDLTGLAQLISIDHRERKQNVYQAKLVRTTGYGYIGSAPMVQSFLDRYDIDYVSILSKNTGLSFRYTEGKKGSWFESFFTNLVELGLGFIPGIGPLLSVAFSLALVAIHDPDSFYYELSLWVPVIKITEAFKRDIRASSNEMKDLVQVRTRSIERNADGQAVGERKVDIKDQEQFFKDALDTLQASKGGHDDLRNGVEAGSGQEGPEVEVVVSIAEPVEVTTEKLNEAEE